MSKEPVDLDKMNEIMRRAFETQGPYSVATWADAVFTELFSCLRESNPLVRHEMAAALGEMFVAHLRRFIAEQAKRLN